MSFIMVSVHNNWEGALVRVVLRIGGSVVASPPDPVLMEKYVHLLKGLRKQCEKLVVVVGGGFVAREFIKVAEGMGLRESDKDEVAISVSRIIAQLLARRLGDLASRMVPTSIDEALRSLERGEIVVMGGLKPGMTTDAVAAMIAERIGADLLVKAADQDGIYTKDPRRYSDAEKINEVSFDELFGLFEEDKHRAGIHQILDPEAVRILQRRKTKTVIVNGFDPENVALAVKGEKVGTIIK